MNSYCSNCKHSSLHPRASEQSEQRSGHFSSRWNKCGKPAFYLFMHFIYLLTEHLDDHKSCSVSWRVDEERIRGFGAGGSRELNGIPPEPESLFGEPEPWPRWHTFLKPPPFFTLYSLLPPPPPASPPPLTTVATASSQRQAPSIPLAFCTWRLSLKKAAVALPTNSG